jgi:hypothetical protein
MVEPSAMLRWVSGACRLWSWHCAMQSMEMGNDKIKECHVDFTSIANGVSGRVRQQLISRDETQQGYWLPSVTEMRAMRTLEWFSSVGGAWSCSLSRDGSRVAFGTWKGGYVWNHVTSTVECVVPASIHVRCRPSPLTMEAMLWDRSASISIRMASVTFSRDGGRVVFDPIIRFKSGTQPQVTGRLQAK